MKLDTIQTSFVGGELGSSLYGRTDIAQYANACAIVQNWIVRPFGSIISTPGTQFINACKTGGSTTLAGVRLIPFVFSVTDSYVIEMGVGYFRFYNNGAVVVSTGVLPYEVAHSYAAADIPSVQYCQNHDVLYFFHANYPPATLTRSSAVSWALVNFPFTGGPFQPLNSNTASTIWVSASSGTVSITSSTALFTVSSGTNVGHTNSFFSIGSTVTDSSTGLSVQGYVQITNVVSATAVTASVLANLSLTGVTNIWALPSWSYPSGWPARCTFFQSRLFGARTNTEPQNVWGSGDFVFTNYAVNGGADDDALNLQLSATQGNDIKWLAPMNDLICGTYGGEFSISSGLGTGNPLTPATVGVIQQTSWGSEAIIPKRIGNFAYYIQRYAQKLREIFYVWTSANYKSVDKTIISPQINGGGFVDIAYQQNPDTVLWCLCTNGTIATMTREVDQDVQGWARQVTAGSYSSICAIPSQQGPYDEIWVIVGRTIQGSQMNYVERFASQIVPATQNQCFYVHSGLTYNAYTLTATGVNNYSNLTDVVLLLTLDNNVTDTSGLGVVVTNNNVTYSSTVAKFGSSGYFSGGGIDSVCKTMLHLDNNVTDSENTPKTFTANNITYSNTTAVFGYSAVFNGTNGYISANSSDFEWGATATLDFWIYPTDFTSTHWIWGNGTSASQINQIIHSEFIQGDVAVSFLNGSQELFFSTSNSVLTLNTWTHVAVVKNSTTYYIFINGISQTLVLQSGSYAASISSKGNSLDIGARLGINDKLFVGNLDEIRWSSMARWVSNFTTPALPYALTASLITSASTNYNLSATAGTVDFWLNCGVPQNNEGIYPLFWLGQSGNTNYTATTVNSNGTVTIFIPSGSSITTGTSVFSFNSWNHMAFVNDTTNTYIFVNGILQAKSTNTVWSADTYPLLIGDYIDTTGEYNLNGYIDQFRFVKGLALWTASFAPPVISSTINMSISATAGTSVIVTTSSAFFSSSNIGERIRAIDVNNNTVGEVLITGYTSSAIVIGNVSYPFNSTTYSGGSWGLSVKTLYGLSYLEQQTVIVLADGGTDYPSKIVSNGTIKLSYNYFVTTVGLQAIQTILTLPQEPKDNEGTAQGKRQRINNVSFKLNNSYTGFSISGTSGTLNPLRFRNTNNQLGTPPSLFTGIVPNITFPDDYRYGSQVLIQNSDPLPIEITSIITTIETFDK